MIAFVLLFCGLLLIFLEFFLPGGVVGALGVSVVVVSIFVFAALYESPYYITLYTVAAFMLLILLFRYALYRIRSKGAKTGLYAAEDQEGYCASSFDTSAIGKVGIVVTDLKPGGHIAVDGVKHSALSVSGYLARGSKVMVIGGQAESLTVKEYEDRDG